MLCACRKLIGTNPDNYDYHRGLCAALQIDLSAPADADSKAAREYVSWQELFPKSAACRRIPLDFLAGPAFATAVKAHITRWRDAVKRA